MYPTQGQVQGLQVSQQGLPVQQPMPTPPGFSPLAGSPNAFGFPLFPLPLIQPNYQMPSLVQPSNMVQPGMPTMQVPLPPMPQFSMIDPQQYLTAQQFGTMFQVPTTPTTQFQPPQVPSPTMASGSPSRFSSTDSGSERSVSPSPAPVKVEIPTRVPRRRRRQHRFGYRTKQNKIDTVYEALVKKYTEQGILAEKEIVLRGPDTIRLHVKKYDALATIEDALRAVESIPQMEISGVSIPLSMKNQFQKKGFLVYIKLADVSMIPLAQEKLRTFAEFRKCEVALPNPASNSQTFRN